MPDDRDHDVRLRAAALSEHLPDAPGFDEEDLASFLDGTMEDADRARLLAAIGCDDLLTECLISSAPDPVTTTLPVSSRLIWRVGWVAAALLAVATTARFLSIDDAPGVDQGTGRIELLQEGVTSERSERQAISDSQDLIWMILAWVLLLILTVPSWVVRKDDSRAEAKA